MNSKIINITIALLCAISVWEFGTAAYIHAKAMVAQHLVSRSWDQSMEKGVKVPPWPWADTWPVASIKVPEYRIEQTILAGMNGRVLAFGPGWMRASARPAEQGTVVVAGHRDTHFEFLQYLQVGDQLEIQGVGAKAVYEVATMEVIDSRYYRIRPNQDDSSLILVTCYPFDAVSTDGPLRYVVRAKKRLNGVSF
jgi:sortase A